jgi:hypothetical protein
VPLLPTAMTFSRRATYSERASSSTRVLLSDGMAVKSIKIADLALVPCRTTVQDLQFLTTTIDIAADKQKPAVVILNAVEEHLKETEQARTFIKTNDFALAGVLE